jgi:hypothetical protein
MRSGHLVVLIGSFTAWIVCGAGISAAASVPIGAPVALGPHALSVESNRNPEIAMMIERRGYPDWAESIEVDTSPPLDSYEVHMYYLRFDREIAFTRASFLGQPLIGIRRFERPMEPGTRERIEGYYRWHDPARRAELAAAHTMAVAEQAEHNAAVAVDSAERSERIAARTQRSGYRRVSRAKH